jgi:hypothetical protein
MDHAGILNALKYGSKPREDAKSLGKFGIGLKLASTAFARSVELITRSEDSPEALCGLLDLDIMARYGRPVTPVIDASPEQIDLLDESSLGGSGTLVVWKNLDRLPINGYQRKAPQAKKFKEQLEDMKFHLGMVFERYLDGKYMEDSAQVKIYVNDELVEAWDPFCTDFMKNPTLMEDVKDEDENVLITLRGYVLPRQPNFPSEARFKEARVLTSYQGTYIYRENRMIEGPIWLDNVTRDLHANGARIDASFDHRVDEILGLNFQKNAIEITNEIAQDQINDFSRKVRKAAIELHRKKNAEEAVEKAAGLHGGSSDTVDKNASKLSIVKVDSVDKENSEISIDIGVGVPHRLKIAIPDNPEVGNFDVRESLNDGVLWEPFYSDVSGRIGVALNAGHDFYRKAYLANAADDDVIRAINYLIWSIAQAETDYSAKDDGFADTFDDFKVQVSRNLRTLVRGLPDPEDKPAQSEPRIA